MTRKATLAAGLLMILAPSSSFACACGCGVFDVGTFALVANGEGSNVFVEYNFMDQNRNWSGTKSAPASANDDVEIKSQFVTLGGQTMFANGWGVMAEVPLVNRTFKTDSGAGIDTFENTALGDIRLMGVYSGFSEDMATGMIFGVKLPTGDFHHAGFDRDTAIGSGSTDLLFGLNHVGELPSDFGWYGQIMWDKPVASQGGYTP